MGGGAHRRAVRDASGDAAGDGVCGRVPTRLRGCAALHPLLQFVIRSAPLPGRLYAVAGHPPPALASALGGARARRTRLLLEPCERGHVGLDHRAHRVVLTMMGGFLLLLRGELEGAVDGATLGTELGACDGIDEGAFEGVLDGAEDGATVGTQLGDALGMTVGTLDGTFVG